MDWPGVLAAVVLSKSQPYLGLGPEECLWQDIRGGFLQLEVRFHKQLSWVGGEHIPTQAVFFLFSSDNCVKLKLREQICDRFTI